MHKQLSPALAAIALLCAACTVTACNSGGNSGAETGKAPSARVAVAQRGTISHMLTLAGQFQPYQVVDVHPKVSGYMKHINVDIGDIVHQGETLAVLEVPELNAQLQQTVFEVQQSKEEMDRAQREISRAEAMYTALHAQSVRLQQAADVRPGLIAQQDLDNAHAQDLSSAAQVDAAKSSMAAAEQHYQAAQSENQRLQALVNYTNVTAPLDGVVIWRYADTGALIQGGTNSNDQALPIVRISQSGILRLRFPVPEDDVKFIREGDPITVRVDAIGRTFMGKIVRFTRNVNFETRTMETEVDVDNKDLAIAPGMYANALLQLDQASNIITVPIEALVIKGQQDTVYVLDSSNHVHERAVTVALQGQKLAGISSGLNAGERVIVGGQEKYQEGELISPLLMATDASESVQETGGMIDMKGEQAVTNAAMAPN